MANLTSYICAKCGMILAEGNIRSLDSLKDPEKLIHADRNKANLCADLVVSHMELHCSSELLKRERQKL